MDSTSTAVQIPIRDVGEWQVLARRVGWDAEYTQLDAGPMDGHFAYSVTDNLRIGNPYTNKSILIRGAPPPGCCALVIPLTPNSSGIFQGQEFGEGQAGILCPNKESYYHTANPNRFMSVSINLSRLRPLLESEQQRSAVISLVENRAVSMEEEVLANLQHRLQQVIMLSSGTRKAGHRALKLAELEQDILAIFVQSLEASPEEGARRITQRRQVVERARDYIEANLGEPLGLEILALETGVSLRTLRYSFNQILGVNPLHYIKLCRLRAARTLMLKASPGEFSVTSVALRCGFSHMSYFARDYRVMYGELPKETLETATHSTQCQLA